MFIKLRKIVVNVHVFPFWNIITFVLRLFYPRFRIDLGFLLPFDRVVSYIVGFLVRAKHFLSGRSTDALGYPENIYKKEMLNYIGLCF